MCIIKEAFCVFKKTFGTFFEERFFAFFRETFCALQKRFCIFQETFCVFQETCFSPFGHRTKQEINFTCPNKPKMFTKHLLLIYALSLIIQISLVLALIKQTEKTIW